MLQLTLTSRASGLQAKFAQASFACVPIPLEEWEVNSGYAESFLVTGVRTVTALGALTTVWNKSGIPLTIENTKDVLMHVTTPL